METNTTTAGFTIAAATEAELAEFRQIRERLPRMLAAWREYEQGPIFGRHLHRFKLADERVKNAVAELREHWNAALVAMLAHAVLDVRAEFGKPGPSECERRALATIMKRLANLIRSCVSTRDTAFKFFANRQLGLPYEPAATEFGAILRKWLFLEPRTECAVTERVRQILDRFLPRLDDDAVAYLRVALPEQLAPDDIEEFQLTVGKLAREYTSAEFPKLFAAELAKTHELLAQLNTFRQKCWTALGCLLAEGGIPTELAIREYGIWERVATARMETAAKTSFAPFGLEFGDAFLSHSEWFTKMGPIWQFLLASAGAVPAAQLGEGLARFVLSPRTLPRWAVPGDSPAEKLKHVLRALSDLALGDVRETAQFRHLAARMQSREAALPERLALFGQFLAFAFERTQPADTRLRATVERLLHDALAHAEPILANADCVLCPERLQSPDDVAFNALLAAEAEEARRANDEFQRWMAEALRPENSANGAEVPEAESGAELPPEEPVALRYVENLGAEQWRLRDFVSARERLGGDLERFLDENGIESVVPARSVAEALRHFLYDLTPEQRRELPLEKIAGTGWRKMKRGGQRIYVLERDGAVYFHLLKRRDWVHADLLEARY
ncbi:MAG TPA: hypothetical protein VK178_14210 [Opitutaceae bacterium]|nr:hypothetical protein [Opitutaceae bacterium]